MSLLDRNDVCPMPWLGMTIRRQGVEVDCWRGLATSFAPFDGVWKDKDVHKWYNTDGHRELREKMICDGARKTCAGINCPFFPEIEKKTIRGYFDEGFYGEKKKRLQSVIDDLDAERLVTSRPPPFLSIDPGIKCNMRCLFCVISDDKFKSSDRWDPTDDEVRNLAPLYDGVVDFHTCGGDTFAWPDDRIELLYGPMRGSEGMGCWVVTNALGLTIDRYEKFFVDGPLNSALVSMHTLNDKRGTDMCRGNVPKARRNLRAIAMKYEKNCLSTLSTVVMANNICDLPYLYKFAAECGFYTYRTSPLIPDQLVERGYRHLCLDTENAYSEFMKVRDEMLELQEKLSPGTKLIGFEDLEKDIISKRPGKKTSISTTTKVTTKVAVDKGIKADILFTKSNFLLSKGSGESLYGIVSTLFGHGYQVVIDEEMDLLDTVRTYNPDLVVFGPIERLCGIWGEAPRYVETKFMMRSYTTMGTCASNGYKELDLIYPWLRAVFENDNCFFGANCDRVFETLPAHQRIVRFPEITSLAMLPPACKRDSMIKIAYGGRMDCVKNLPLIALAAKIIMQDYEIEVHLWGDVDDVLSSKYGRWFNLVKDIVVVHPYANGREAFRRELRGNKVDVFVSPAFSESYCHSAADAITAGVPVAGSPSIVFLPEEWQLKDLCSASELAKLIVDLAFIDRERIVDAQRYYHMFNEEQKRILTRTISSIVGLQ